MIFMRVLTFLLLTTPAFAITCPEVRDDKERLRCWDRQSERAIKGKEIAVAEYIIGTTIAPTACGFSLNFENASSFKHSNELDDFALFSSDRPRSVQRAIDDAAERARSGKDAFCKWAYEYFGPQSLTQFLKKKD
jgi:hypothetical protein